MNRRLFMLASLATSATLSILRNASAQAVAASASSGAASTVDDCLVHSNQVSAESCRFSAYEHHHKFLIPIDALIAPPKDGYTARTTILDQGSLDEKALDAFLKSSGLPSSLHTHSHQVTITQAQLEAIATGQRDVLITVMTPGGNLGHHFRFTASKSTLIKIKNARAQKKA